MIKDHPVFNQIHQDFDKHLKNLREAIRQPSISAENRGVREMAELLVLKIRALGVNCKLVEIGGYPIRSFDTPPIL